MTPEELFALDEHLHPNSGAKFGPTECSFMLHVMERNVKEFQEQLQDDEKFLAGKLSTISALHRHIECYEILIEKLRKGSEIE